jgi:hypothetical protein
MNILWIVVGIVIAGVVAIRMGIRLQPRSTSDLGFVSDRWLSEHRLSETSGH